MMNRFVPDWSSSMGDAFAPLGGEDDGLIELLWCNGHVVMQSQPLRKPQAPPRNERAAAAADDEAAAWFQYPVEDPLGKDLFSELFGEAPADAAPACKAEAAAVNAPQSRLMPPPKEKECLGDGGCGAGERAAAATETGESSMLTIGSSFCGSNHVQTPRVPAPAPPTRARGSPTVASSSMQPRSGAAKVGPLPCAAARRSDKRKQRGAAAEAEDAELESTAVTCEPAQKLTTAKRRRAAEVHNLSERRRRDRINEKMKALQELIPHCNKTDKASMLDEAIEYLKSLQLQLQMMWVGGGLAAAAAPVMFPAAGVHQYMQRMLGPPHVASMSRMPFMAPPVGHMPVPVADAYACCLAVDHHLQTQPPPAMVPPRSYCRGSARMHACCEPPRFAREISSALRAGDELLSAAEPGGNGADITS